jgi:hypothetical protein
MFITTNSYSFPMPNFSGGSPSHQYWLAVELSNPIPWFFITIRLPESVGNRRKVTHTRKNMLLTEIPAIERMASNYSETAIQFESALIITPPCMNLSATWQMEPLSAIWTGDEPTLPGVKVDIFETETGKKYVSTAHQSPIAELKNQTIRFKFPVQRQ